eukprot:m.18023 g.18023  ORF g.18023 m.18023 type:complete len:530 (-) comp11797_c0_seq1:57-1646(-)
MRRFFTNTLSTPDVGGSPKLKKRECSAKVEPVTVDVQKIDFHTAVVKVQNTPTSPPPLELSLVTSKLSGVVDSDPQINTVQVPNTADTQRHSLSTDVGFSDRIINPSSASSYAPIPVITSQPSTAMSSITKYSSPTNANKVNATPRHPETILPNECSSITQVIMFADSKDTHASTSKIASNQVIKYVVRAQPSPKTSTSPDSLRTPSPSLTPKPNVDAGTYTSTQHRIARQPQLKCEPDTKQSSSDTSIGSGDIPVKVQRAAFEDHTTSTPPTPQPSPADILMQALKWEPPDNVRYDSNSTTTAITSTIPTTTTANTTTTNSPNTDTSTSPMPIACEPSTKTCHVGDETPTPSIAAKKSDHVRTLRLKRSIEKAIDRRLSNVVTLPTRRQKSMESLFSTLRHSTQLQESRGPANKPTVRRRAARPSLPAHLDKLLSPHPFNSQTHKKRPASIPDSSESPNCPTAGVSKPVQPPTANDLCNKPPPPPPRPETIELMSTSTTVPGKIAREPMIQFHKSLMHLQNLQALAAV